MTSTSRQSGFKRILTIIIIMLLATIAGIWAARAVLDDRAAVDELEATRFPMAREITPFKLTDHNNAVFDNDTLKQRWSFLFFGYTHCPDVCPTTMSILNSVANRLQDLDADIRFVFVSVDPERDTPEQLARYVRYFNGDFIGVTGPPEALEQLTKPLGIFSSIGAAEAGSDNYQVDHTASVLLFDPDGRFHAVFSTPLSAEKISTDFRKMVRDYQ